VTVPQPSPEPEQATDLVDDAGASLTFIGNATVLVHYRGLTLLTDPSFLHAGSRVHLGYGLTARKLLDPALDPDLLPPLHGIVLSHLHGDHFDRAAHRGLDHGVPLVSTRHAAATLRLAGWRSTVGLSTWGTTELSAGSGHVRITAVPAAHTRSPLRRLLPPVMGSVWEFSPVDRPGSVDLRLYVTGDTVLQDGLNDVTDRWPDLDLAVMHLGGTRVLGALLSMDAAQGVDFLRRVRPRSAIPVHTDDFSVFTSSRDDFARAVETAGLSQLVRYVDRGETAALDVRPRRDADLA
jgi:L-ascorbate metabolism protein UlaG (beta-lactamase superfamily)